jgi:hypothetical protein
MTNGGSQARRRLAEAQRQQHRQQLRVRALAGGLVVVAAVVIALLIIAQRPGGKPGVTGAATGATVDGISCSTTEQTAYHIHGHLAVYIGGAARKVPAGIGIPGPQEVQDGFVLGGKCLYWLHTHDATGIIHIESPVERVYTLGDFFDIWGRTLTRSQVGDATGKVTAFVNGKRFAGDPRAIELRPQEAIQLDVGPVVPPRSYTFPPGL